MSTSVSATESYFGAYGIDPADLEPQDLIVSIFGGAFTGQYLAFNAVHEIMKAKFAAMTASDMESIFAMTSTGANVATSQFLVAGSNYLDVFTERRIMLMILAGMFPGYDVFAPGNVRTWMLQSASQPLSDPPNDSSTELRFTGMLSMYGTFPYDALVTAVLEGGQAISQTYLPGGSESIGFATKRKLFFSDGSVTDYDASNIFELRNLVSPDSVFAPFIQNVPANGYNIPQLDLYQVQLVNSDDQGVAFQTFFNGIYVGGIMYSLNGCWGIRTYKDAN